LKEKRGKGGLVPPNNRFERTRGTSPLAAQPNVRLMAQCATFVESKITNIFSNHSLND
jgi:hypothetical protein